MNAANGGDDAWLLDYDIPAEAGQGAFGLRAAFADGQPVGSVFPPTHPPTKAHLVLLYDWAPDSNEASAGWAEAAGEGLYALLGSLDRLRPDRLGRRVPGPGRGAGQPAAVQKFETGDATLAQRFNANTSVPGIPTALLPADYVPPAGVTAATAEWVTDTTPPKVTATDPGPGLRTGPAALTFDEPLDPATAALPASYGLRRAVNGTFGDADDVVYPLTPTYTTGPATGAGLPVRLSNGAGVTEVVFTRRYDPALLTVTGRLNLLETDGRHWTAPEDDRGALVLLPAPTDRSAAPAALPPAALPAPGAGPGRRPRPALGRGGRRPPRTGGTTRPRGRCRFAGLPRGRRAPPYSSRS